MCGIAGLVPVTDKWRDGRIYAQMLERMHHRGPDDFGLLVQCDGRFTASRDIPSLAACERASAVLLHKRLSILDTSSAGWQPMTTPDGNYAIVLNGEIYNFVELRKELEASGETFATGTDTEVLLRSLIRQGTAALPRLVGMFAFAFLDVRAKRLLLARDFFGIKPLYYTESRDGFGFASEVRTLLELPGIERRLEPQIAYDYLLRGATDHGSQTFLASVKQLLPGHLLDIDLAAYPKARPTPVGYWSIDPNERSSDSFEVAASKVRDLFLESVKLHLRSDVPIGANLSGGVDSSAVVMGIRAVAGRNFDLHTVSYLAEDPALNEDRWAAIVAKEAGALRHTVQFSEDDLASELDDLVAGQDYPFATLSMYAENRIYRAVRGLNIKVMLGGQGADEMFAGYTGYLGMRLASLVRQGKLGEALDFLSASTRPWQRRRRDVLLMGAASLLPSNLQPAMRRLIGKSPYPHWMNRSWFDAQGGVATPSKHSRESEILRETLLRAMRDDGLHHHLRSEDRSSMRFSIESRLPFLTPALVKYVMSLPESYLIAPDGTTKAVFRKAMRGVVPEVILDRRDKIGFQTPGLSLFRKLKPRMEQILRSDAAAQIPLFERSAMLASWEALVEGRAPFDWRAWRWVNFILWSQATGVTYS